MRCRQLVPRKEPTLYIEGKLPNPLTIPFHFTQLPGMRLHLHATTDTWGLWWNTMLG